MMSSGKTMFLKLNAQNEETTFIALESRTDLQGLVINRNNWFSSTLKLEPMIKQHGLFGQHLPKILNCARIRKPGNKSSYSMLSWLMLDVTLERFLLAGCLSLLKTAIPISIVSCFFKSTLSRSSEMLKVNSGLKRRKLLLKAGQ